MKSELGRRILALGLAVSLCVCDAMPAFAEDVINTDDYFASIDVSEINSFEEPEIIEGIGEEFEILDVSEANGEAAETVVGASDAIAEEILVPEVVEQEISEIEVPDIQEAAEVVLVPELEDIPEVIESIEIDDVEEISDNEIEVSSLIDDAIVRPTVYEEKVGSTVVTVTLANAEDVPVGSELVVEAVAVTEDIVASVEEGLEENTVVDTILAYDISFVCDGVEVEPLNPATVSITDVESDQNTEVYYYDENGNAENMNASSNNEGVEFEAPHFSTYLIVNKSVHDWSALGESEYLSFTSNRNWTTQSDSEGYGKMAFQVRVYLNNNLVETNPSTATRFADDERRSDYQYGYHPGYQNGYQTSFTANFNISGITQGYELSEVKVGRHWELSKVDVSDSGTFSVSFGDMWNKYYVDIYLVTNTKVSTVSTGVLKLYNYRSNADSNTGINNNHIFKFLNSGSDINAWTDDSESKPLVNIGIVKNTLGTDGYPVLTNNNESLEYLFNPSTDGVLSYSNDAKGLFVMKDGYYYYNSNEYYAILSGDQVTVTEDSVTKRFDPFDSRKINMTQYRAKGSEDKNKKDNNLNYFGLSYVTNFIQPYQGTIENNGTTEDMVFEFSGDDDVWVFVDGVLVLDIGGVHSAAQGSINFATGEVVKPKAKNSFDSSKVVSEYNSTSYSIRDMFVAADSANASLFDSYVDENGATRYRFKDYTQHTLSVFYFERGAYESNFKIKFNLQTIPEGTLVVSKQVVDPGEKIDSNKEFEFEVKDNNGNFVAAGTQFDIYKNGKLDRKGTVQEAGIIKLKDGESAYLSLTAGVKYTVTEKTLDTQDSVFVNDIEFEKPIENELVVSAEKTIPAKGSESILFKNVYNTESLTVDKTVSVVDYDNRLYKINITADYNGTELVESVVENSTTSDVALIIDSSGSMIFTDAAVVLSETGSSKDAYNNIDKLDKGRYYFTKSCSSYGDGLYADSTDKEHLCPGAIKGGVAYGIPTSGSYLYYSDGKWKKYSFFWGTTSDVSTSNCPTTVYTNRSAALIDAATSFVENLASISSDNRVAVITFNKQGASKYKTNTTDENGKTQHFIKLDAEGLKKVKEAINNSYGVYDTSTYADEGINKATAIFDDSVDDNFAIYFADGTKDNSDSSQKNASDALQQKATVYAIGFGSKIKKADLSVVAGSESNVITTDDAAGLANAFSSITNEIKVKTVQLVGKGYVIDYVDDRFYVTDAYGNALSNGATVSGGTLTVDPDTGAAYIEWQAEVGHGDRAFATSIYVKAKEDFLGGNVITTNGPLSHVVVGKLKEILPKPSVNVKALELDVTDGREVIFLGDSLTPLASASELTDSLSVKKLDGSLSSTATLSEDEVKQLVENKSLSKRYSYRGTADEIGTLEYTLDYKYTGVPDASELITKEAKEAYETYTLTVTYKPDSKAARLTTHTEVSEVKGTEVASPAASADGKYIIDVVDGKIQVVKVINAGEIEWDDGDPIFTFRLTNTANKNSITKIVHFDKKIFDGKSGDVTLTIEFTGLAKGSYKLEELKTLGYEYVSGSITNVLDIDGSKHTYSNVVIEDNTKPEATVTFGTRDSEGDFIRFSYITLKNKRVAEYFMDRDELKNSVSYANGKMTISQNREKETIVFSTKEELEKYLADLKKNN